MIHWIAVKLYRIGFVVRWCCPVLESSFLDIVTSRVLKTSTSRNLNDKPGDQVPSAINWITVLHFCLESKYLVHKHNTRKFFIFFISCVISRIHFYAQL